MLSSIVIKNLCWLMVGFMGMLLLGCKPGRPEFAMPKIKMITGENLHSVVAFNAEEALVIGNYGVIYDTSKAGKTVKDWQLLKSGVGDTLLCEAVFLNRDIGWVVGTKGTIIHTTDAGKTWVKQNSGTEKNLFSVSFADAQNGWAAGEYGTLLHTADGGNHWESQTKEIDKMLNGVCFVDARKGWVVGEFGTILHTTDGGEHWKSQRCEDIETVSDMMSFDWKPMPALYEVCFINENNGWIVGMDGIILKTENGGKQWRKLETGIDTPLYGIAIKGKKGWIVGKEGYYLLSEDGGETWELKDDVIKTRFWLRDVAFSDENNGWIVGASGTVVRSIDGGKSWELISGMSYDMPEYGLTDF